MTIHAAGTPIAISQVNAELGVGNVTTTMSSLRTFLGVPSGPIALSKAYGKSKVTPINVVYSSPGSYSYTVPAGVYTLYCTGTGAGGGGGGLGPNPRGSNYYPGGGGAGCIRYPLAVIPGQVINIVIGTGGAGQGSGGGTGSATTFAGVTLYGGNGGGAGGGGGASTGANILAGTGATGYWGSPGSSGASSDPSISTSYGYGGTANTDYRSTSGTSGYLKLSST